jgi:uncharacterized protein (DUF433 family)
MIKEYVTQNDGAYRVAGTRVSLDSVVYSHKGGESAESIQRSFPTLTLGQVHGAIAYYLDHDKEINRYLIEGEREFEKLKRASRKAYPWPNYAILDSNTSARNETYALTHAWYEKLERTRKEIPSFLEEKTCFQADVNLNENIVTGVCLRVPEIDFQTAREAGLHGFIDSQVLDLAANQKRILVTQDQRTMPKHVDDSKRVRGNLGVLIISQKSNIEPAIEELILIWKAFDSWEHVGLILYL